MTDNKCQCDFCQMSRSVRAIQEKLEPDDAKVIESLVGQLIEASDMASYWQAKYEGKWPERKAASQTEG
jgi:hypothetical protein